MAKNPINDPEFWKGRLEAVKLEERPIHQAVYAENQEIWDNIQATTREILQRVLTVKHPEKEVPWQMRLLDAGCGYGALLDVLPPDFNKSQYMGVDLSPDLIAEAERLHPEGFFTVARLNQLPFADRFFDIAVCRSIEGMVIENLGIAAWHAIEKELLRVADRILLLGYTQPTVFKVIEYVNRSVSEGILTTIQHKHGSLIYRGGMDGSVELYDISVDKEHRREGIGRLLVKQLTDYAYGTIYGFCRADNGVGVQFYRSLGFKLQPVGNFYRGSNAIMFYKPFMES